MTAFVIIGGIGLAIVVVSVLFGDFLDGVLDVEHFDLGDGILSTPVIGSFLAAFGAAGAFLVHVQQTSLLVAVAGGLGAGAVLGGVALAAVRSLMNMPTDATPRTQDLVGSMGTVVTRIPANGLGEVSLTSAGQRWKVNARSDAPIPSGSKVIVVEVTSPTSVFVTESDL